MTFPTPACWKCDQIAAMARDDEAGDTLTDEEKAEWLWSIHRRLHEREPAV